MSKLVSSQELVRMIGSSLGSVRLLAQPRFCSSDPILEAHRGVEAVCERLVHVEVDPFL